MALNWIDDELVVIDSEGFISHVFERIPSISRPAYKHMAGWMEINFESWAQKAQLGEAPQLDPSELWRLAGEAWEALTPDHKMVIWSMCQQETQNARDICDGLLATLGSYQGVKSVKSAFQDAILSARDQFS